MVISFSVTGVTHLARVISLQLLMDFTLHLSMDRGALNSVAVSSVVIRGKQAGPNQTVVHGILKDGRLHYGEFNWLEPTKRGGTATDAADAADAADELLGTETADGWWYKTTVPTAAAAATGSSEAGGEGTRGGGGAAAVGTASAPPPTVYVQSRGAGRNWECRDIKADSNIASL